MNDIEPTLRQAGPDDAATIACLFRYVRQSALSFLPDLHTPSEDLAFFRDTVLAKSTVIVAEAPAVIGFLAWRSGWVDHLYIHPEHARRGLGSRLLSHALAGQHRVDLWAFQRNRAALAFYRRHGFRVLYETDGANNEEREPDVRLAWQRGQSPE